MKMQAQTTTFDLFPEVEWDRWAGLPNEYNIFGWIQRDDGWKDFLVLEIIDNEITDFCTSSAKYSKEFSKRLLFPHYECNKVNLTQSERGEDEY